MRSTSLLRLAAIQSSRNSIAALLLGLLAAQTGVAQRGSSSSGSSPTLPDIPPIASFVAPAPESKQIQRDAGAPASHRLEVNGLSPSFLHLLGPFRRPQVPELFPGSALRFSSLIRDDKLYLSLHDAIALALENNLDVELERYNLQLADTDLLRAKGGGSLRGIDYNVQEPPNGVGGPGSPLLNSAATNTNPITPTVTDLTSLNSTAQTQTNLSTNGQNSNYASGPNTPLFDPSLIFTGGYLRRSNTVTLVSTTDTGGSNGSSSGTPTQTEPLNFVAANVAYLQGFSSGAQLEATANNDSQVIYATKSQLDPFYSPSTSVTLTQPLMRGRGRSVNLRYIRIAKLDRKVSRLLFEQQVLESIYGVSRIYFDLVSLGENVSVKQEALRAAEKLRQDDADQVVQGTLAPIELTRAAALVSSSQFDLVQAQGLYRQEEVILRNLLIRTTSDVFSASFSEIIPTDHIVVPDLPESLSVTELVQQGLARRPDVAQAKLQISANQVSVDASRNGMLPQLNVYGNVETRGSSEASYEPLGSNGTGIPAIPQNLALGGLRTSTIYQGGVQLTLPLRNRIASSDVARDTIQLRQSQARAQQLSNQVRQEVENAVIAVQTAQAAYKAAENSRQFQTELLQAEQDKLAVGQSTSLLVIQNETYLAQARSSEIAARSNWKKAKIDLSRSVGALLDQNNIILNDAIDGSIRP